MSKDFFKIKKGVNLEPQASAPSSPQEGDFYFNNTDGLYIYKTGGWVNLDSASTLDEAEVQNFLDWVHETTPANPPAGVERSYFKSDGKMYKLNSAGAETQIGGESVADFFVASAAELAAAIAATPADGSTICVIGNITLTSAVTIPDNTIVFGKGWSTVINIDSASGQLILGNRAQLKNLRIRTNQSSVTLVDMPNVFSFLYQVYFDVTASQTLTCVSVSGTSNRILYSLFQFMTGNTAVNNTGTDTVQLYNYTAL